MNTVPENTPRIRSRDRDTVLQSLRAGVVPRVGQQHIQVGRAKELSALLSDLDSVTDGGSFVRFIIGEYGVGKSFFLNLVRAVALRKQLVTVHADLSPDRRLRSTDGRSRNLYAELARNLSTRSKPDGGAMPSLVGRFVTHALQEASASGVDPHTVIRSRLACLEELTGGYSFAEVVDVYWTAYETGNEALLSSAVRWLRGEYSTRRDSYASLGVRDIIDDTTYYDYLKILAVFVRLAGFAGLVVCVDELVNIYKIAHRLSRDTNYEQLLRIVNDCLQGSATRIGFVFSGTPELMYDTRRGAYSYRAIRDRLAVNPYARDGLVDFSGPVIELPNLTPEDLFVLLTKLRHLYAHGKPEDYLLPDRALMAFMDHCDERIGDAYFRTPRTTIKEFLGLLAVLDQNPTVRWAELIARVEIAPDSENPSDGGNSSDELATLRL